MGLWGRGLRKESPLAVNPGKEEMLELATRAAKPGRHLMK